MKVATWNINSIKVRLDHVLAWLAENPVDVLGLQELKCENDHFPVEVLQQHGYYSLLNGQRTYNGVALLSRQPLSDCRLDVPGFSDTQKRVIAASKGNLRIVNAYMPNGQHVGSEKFQYKLTWFARFSQLLQQELAAHGSVLLMGDFNVAPEPRDVHDPEAWQGKVLFSEQERAAFKKFLKLGFVDAFRQCHFEEKQYSWWDYRQLAWRRNHGLRIDHILLSKQLQSRLIDCWIDKTPRRWERPSDHAPVIAHLRED